MKIVDIHTHGIGGFDTRTNSENDILKLAEIQGRHGVSEIIPAIYPSDTDTMRGHILAVKKAMEKQRSAVSGQQSGAGIDKPEAVISGIHLEGPFLNPSKCGALDAASFLTPDEHSFDQLIDGFEDIVKIITVAPELKGAASLIKKISDMGIVASMGHSDATYKEAEACFHAGARGITHIFNAMRGIHHREPGLSGFGLMNNDIYIEVIADPFHLDQEIIKLIFSSKNPDRIIIISDTVKESMAVPAAQGIKNKDNKLLGGSMTIKESADRLVEIGLDKTIVHKAVSENPARYLQRN